MKGSATLAISGLLMILAGCAETLPSGPYQCPDWSAPSSHNYANRTYSNFGCATATNLTRMVADPRDLVAGHGDARPDTERTVSMFKQYRAGLIPAPQDSQADSVASGGASDQSGTDSPSSGGATP